MTDCAGDLFECALYHMQVVYVYGGNHDFCTFEHIAGDSVRFLPSSWMGVAQWFGVTAFLFCVHSMVSFTRSVLMLNMCVCVCVCVCVCAVYKDIFIHCTCN